MKISKYFKPLVALIILLSPISSYGITCDQESPNLKKQGDEYYELTKKQTLTKKQRNLVKKIFSRIDDKSIKGKTTTTVCIGPASASRKQQSNEIFEADSEISSDGSLKIILDVHNPKKGSSYKETLIYLSDKSPQEIKKITENELHLVSRYRKRRPGNIRTGSIFTEEIIEMKLTGNTLEIKTTNYISGYFALLKEMKFYL